MCVFKSLLFSVLGLHYCSDPNIGSLVLEDTGLSFNLGSWFHISVHSLVTPNHAKTFV